MNKNKIKNFLYTYLFISITIIGSLVVLSDIDIVQDSSLVIITFLINGIIIIQQLCKKSKLGYSLRDIVFLFMFLFMFMSPLVQYIRGSFPWWDTYLFSEKTLIYTNLIIMIFLIIYIIIYKFTFNTKIKLNNIKNREIKNIELVIDIFFIFTILCSVYIIQKTGFSNLFARSTNGLKIDSSSYALIVSNTFRSIPVIYVGMNLLFIQNYNRIYKILPFIVGIILMLLTNFPTSTARFWMASVYLGILIIVVKKTRNPHLFKILIFIGILLVFPAINVFRHNTVEDVIRSGINLQSVSDAFLEGDYDAYSMLVRSIIYVNWYGSTLGHQLLGNLLFFIPRTLWPSKPIGSGAMIAHELGWKFSNVSCPYIGEGYVNFGIFGILIFPIILGIITKFSDLGYIYIKKNNNKKITFIELIYPFSIGFLFFILRGDLLSSLSYYIGFMIPIIIIYIIQRFRYY